MYLTQSEVMGCPTSGPEPDLAWEVSRLWLEEVWGLASARRAWPQLEGRVKLAVHGPGVPQEARDLCVPGFCSRALESGPRLELSTSLRMR